jgi:Sap, sulfolipid-1-addressing protein
VGSLLASLLPLALGAAISPLLLMAEVLALSSSDRPKRKAWLLVIGCGATLLAFEVALLLVGSHVSATHAPHPLEDVVVGVAAAALFAWLFLSAWAKRHQAPSGPGFIDRVGTARPLAFLGLGVLLMVTNASTLILVFPAVRLIIHAHVSAVDQVVALGILTCFGLAPVLLPATLVSVLGRRGEALTSSLNRFVTAHATQLTMGLEAVFFAYFLIKAIRGAMAL